MSNAVEKKILKLNDLISDDHQDKSVVIIDTNFLLSVAELKVDIFSGIEESILVKYEIIMLDAVLRELDHIIETSKGKKKAAANLAKQILNSKNHLVLEGYNESPSADESILDFLDDYRRKVDEKKDVYIATQDKELRVRILKNMKNCKFLKIRQQKYVVLD